MERKIVTMVPMKTHVVSEKNKIHKLINVDNRLKRDIGYSLWELIVEFSSAQN